MGSGSGSGSSWSVRMLGDGSTVCCSSSRGLACELGSDWSISLFSDSRAWCRAAKALCRKLDGIGRV